MDNIVIYGYEFNNKEDAEKAKQELDKISKIKEQINMSKPLTALNVYNKIVSQNLFTTPIGLEYLRNIQIELANNKSIDSSKILSIKVNNIAESESTNDTKYTIMKHKDENKALLKQVEKNKEKFIKSVIVNIFLVIVIIIMFIITKRADKFDVDNYKQKLENEYMSWENELKERESSISEKELTTQP